MADDDVTLRPETLAILQQFMKEKEEAQKKEAKEAEDTGVTLTISEDWQASQFWYDERTCQSLRNEILRLAEECRKQKIAKRKVEVAKRGWKLDDAAIEKGVVVKVACLSCPSTFKALVAKGSKPELPSYVKPYVFEIDTRFSVFGESFVHYDFNRPDGWKATHVMLEHAVDIISLDPPFLNPDCLAAFAETIEMLRPKPSPVEGVEEWKVPILLCTGAVMLPHARRLLECRPTLFHVGHAKALSNPFALYTNYPPSEVVAGDDGTTGFDLEAERAAEVESSLESKDGKEGTANAGAGGK
jgi:EEF1A lysine methyltransferase 1